jgi:hypothetical protein
MEGMSANRVIILKQIVQNGNHDNRESHWRLVRLLRWRLLYTVYNIYNGEVLVKGARQKYACCVTAW